MALSARLQMRVVLLRTRHSSNFSPREKDGEVMLTTDSPR
jgi:hypothetical protein